MDSTTTEVVFEFGPYVLIDQEAGLSACIFIPSTNKPGQKLPLLVYYHGGAFLVGSPFCPTYHNYMTSLVAEANIITKHYNNEGPEGRLSDHADFQRVFLAGDSAGGNTVYNMVARAGIEDLASIKILGACLVHTYFLQERFWRGQLLTFCVINLAMDSRLSSLGCTRVLICVAEKDVLEERGLLFCETLRKSGWNGEVQIVETEGEEHVFRLFNPDCEKAIILLKRLASFFN
ncbi:hypothetical protein ACJW31_07G105400 [Castanea mollissima]